MFSDYPITIYDGKLVTDILKKVQFTDGFRKSSYVENYLINEDDTPESLAFYLYNNPSLSWIILSLNSLMDRNNEWPYPYSVMEKIISNKYAGSSIFLRDPVIDFSFSDIYSISKTTTYLVSEYDRSLNKIVTSTQITNISSGDTITITFKDGTSKQVVVGRVVYDDSYSLRYFEDNEQNLIDPRGSDDASIEYESICDACLLGYINGENELYAVTNRTYELKINDDKRHVLIMRPEFLPQLMGRLKSLFERLNKSSNIIDVQNSFTIGDLSE